MNVTMSARSAGAQGRAVFCGWNVPEQWMELEKRLRADGRFFREKDAVKAVDTSDGTVILLGRPAEDDVRHLMELTARALRAAADERVSVLELDLNGYGGGLASALVARSAAMACIEASYRFERYREKKDPCSVTELRLLHSDAGKAGMKKALALGISLSEAVCAARDAVNRTSRDLTPTALAEWALALCEGVPVSGVVLDREALEKLDAQALLGVALGGHNPPAMAVLRYCGDPKHPDRVTALIGKGVTYDSGGLSLKSKDGMVTMHDDMGGAAATAAAMRVIARAGLKINVTAVIPACENMLAPNGYRPGDVIGSMDGKTIKIRSTDAEGRLLLIDAMTYALRCEGAARLIDIATLTGGAAKAYGPLVTAVAVTDDVLREAMQRANETCGDLLWEMPLVPDYISYLRTSHADLVNSAGGDGSSMITAAVFLREFTDGKPWMHIDIAGTAWTGKTYGRFCEGGTGVGVAALYDICENLVGR